MGVRIHDVFLATALTLAVATPVFAAWQDQASNPDIDRLVQLPQRRSRTMMRCIRQKRRRRVRASFSASCCDMHLHALMALQWALPQTMSYIGRPMCLPS